MCSIDSEISIFADGEKYVENNFVCFTNPSDFLEIGWLRFRNVSLGPRGMRKKKNKWFLFISRTVHGTRSHGKCHWPRDWRFNNRSSVRFRCQTNPRKMGTRDMGNGSKKRDDRGETGEAWTRRSTNQPAEDVTLCLLDSGEGQEKRHDRSPQRHEEQD